MFTVHSINCHYYFKIDLKYANVNCNFNWNTKKGLSIIAIDDIVDKFNGTFTSKNAPATISQYSVEHCILIIKLHKIQHLKHDNRIIMTIEYKTNNYFGEIINVSMHLMNNEHIMM